MILILVYDLFDLCKDDLCKDDWSFNCVLIEVWLCVVASSIGCGFGVINGVLIGVWLCVVASSIGCGFGVINGVLIGV